VILPERQPGAAGPESRTFLAFIVNEKDYIAGRFSVQYAPSSTVRMVHNQPNKRVLRSALLVGILDPTLPGPTGASAVQRVGADALKLARRSRNFGSTLTKPPPCIGQLEVFREDNPAVSETKFTDG
jgi:hypothetical protein